MKPYLKWAGGKRWFVSRHANLLPDSYCRYVEPFVGSGAVFFHLSPSPAVLSDANNELIETYIAIREKPREVWKHLKRHQANHSEEYYYKTRASSLRTLASRAARFIYLNRTCFNGLYRVNLRGEFNVPKGTKDSVVFPDDDFEAVSNALRHTHLIAQDFASTLRSVREEDLIFVDPPYTVRHNNNNFIKYNENIFTWADQERLAKKLLVACQRGTRVLLTNANSGCIIDLYGSSIWVKIPVIRYSVLASDINRRCKTTELVITNYLNKKGEQVEPRF